MKTYTVIVTYNGMKWIKNTLSSVIDSSHVIVVDNNSSDNTVAFIKKGFPSVKIFEETVNHGFGIANNIGISYAIKQNADAVFLLNQDASLEKDTLKILEEAAENNEYGILSPLHLNGNGEQVDYHFLKVTSPFSAGRLTSDLILKKMSQKIYDVKFINAAAWFIPKRVFYIVGGFDPLFFLYGEDDNYCQRVLYHEFKIGIVPNAKIFHDSENNNIQLSKAGSKKYFSQIKNKLLTKYADVNTNNFKNIKKYKFYIFRNILKNIFILNFSKARILQNKFKLLEEKRISVSVKKNRQQSANYLNIE